MKPITQDIEIKKSNLLIRFWRLLNYKRRFQLAGIIFVMIASGTAEMISLGTIIPFLTVLTSPETLWESNLIKGIASFAGIYKAEQLLLPATLLFATSAICTALIRLANIWLAGRFTASIGSEMSCEAYKRTLYQPYIVQITQNSSSVITGVIQYINDTTAVLGYLLQVCTGSIVFIFIFVPLLLVDWQVALSAGVIFGAAYLIIILISKKKLEVTGKRITNASSNQLKILQEGLGAIRDILLDSSQGTYLKIYRGTDYPLRRWMAQTEILRFYPRYLMEGVGLVLIAALSYGLVIQHGGVINIIPVLGAIALGAQRLLPALQQIYTSWAGVRKYSASMAKAFDLLEQPLPKMLSSKEIKPIELKNSIRFKNVSFSYEKSSPKVVQSINLTIEKGERIGFIGKTGSGKSTSIDLLMGLLEPTEGTITVDDQNINCKEFPERLLAWRATIAHVPQSIYLSDSSIAENIAFGIPLEKIDRAKVIKAARKAQIHEFIESCSNGYQTTVGERGVRLSGGQKQRIGIARALYKESKVLIFDEATSALDNATETALMEAIDGLSKTLTVIMIAHRLSTVCKCQKVFELDEGKIVRSLSGEALLTQTKN